MRTRGVAEASMGFWGRIKDAFHGGARQSGDGAPSPSPEQVFRQEVRRIAESCAFIRSMKDDPEFPLGLRATTAEGDFTMNLANLFAETREDPPDLRENKIRRFLATMERERKPLSWEEARQRLVPIIRPVAFVGQFPREHHPISRPFAPALHELLVIDEENSMRYIGARDLKEWGVGAEEGFAAARAHLIASASDDDVERYDDTVAYPTWWVAKDDDYQTSRLVIPGWLASFSGRVDGKPVAIAPARGQLIIFGDGDPSVVARFAEMAEREYRAASRAISPVLYTAAFGGQIVPYECPPDSPLAALVGRGTYLLLTVEYKTQQEQIRQRLAAEGKDIFVATYNAVTRKDGGSTLSYAAWSQNVDSLLPKTDVLVLAGGEFGPHGPEWSAWVRWETVERHAPGCLRREEALPLPLFRTVKFPDAVAIERIRAEAADEIWKLVR